MHKLFFFNIKRLRHEFYLLFFSELEWIPQNKIKIVKKKLNGANPCLVMLEELKNVHFQHDQADKVYEMIFEGTNYPNSKRSKLKEKEILTAEEQVCYFIIYIPICKLINKKKFVYFTGQFTFRDGQGF